MVNLCCKCAGLDNAYSIFVDMCRSPFLDVLTTMECPQMALTIHEHDEWGDPLADPVTRDYIASYCPCSNAHNTPSNPCNKTIAFISVGLGDTRLGAWESVKFAQRIRVAKVSTVVENNSRETPVVVKLLPDCGHEGPQSGSQLKTLLAEELAFLDDVVRR